MTRHIKSDPPATYGAGQAASLSPKQAETVAAALEILAERHKPGELISSPGESAAYLRLRLAHLEYETFGVIWLDNRHRLLGQGEIFRGTVDGASVFPREVVKEALALNAAACILYHNHPSGMAEPSQADLTITRRLKEALALVDVRVLDHLIVSAQEHVSLAERGHL